MRRMWITAGMWANAGNRNRSGNVCDSNLNKFQESALHAEIGNVPRSCENWKNVAIKSKNVPESGKKVARGNWSVKKVVREKKILRGSISPPHFPLPKPIFPLPAPLSPASTTPSCPVAYASAPIPSIWAYLARCSTWNIHSIASNVGFPMPQIGTIHVPSAYQNLKNRTISRLFVSDFSGVRPNLP